MIHIIGDKVVNEVTKDDIKKALNFKKNMPVMNKNPYRKWGFEETILQIKNGYEIENESDLVSSKTVKETLKSFQSFFSAYLFKEKDILSCSPTDNITFKYESKPYADYSNEQMKKIVSYCEAHKSEKTMVILIGAYTGMRLSEICNLTNESIKYDQESGFYYILIEHGKTDAARRIIPICSKLKALGFLDVINNIKIGKRLFDKKSSLITDELKDIREKLSIPHENEYGQRRVFHSIRHSVITNARGRQVTDTFLQKVVGHQIIKTITDRYTHNFAIKNLISVTEDLDW